MNKKIRKAVPHRTSQSPLVECANFFNKDGKSIVFINLIRLHKAYADGRSWVIYETTNIPALENKVFNDYEKAKKCFDNFVTTGKMCLSLRDEGITGN